MNKAALLGQVIDNRYTLLEVLGEGGMGVVFKARQAVLGRPVAIKMLKKEFLRNEESLERFIREGKAISLLSHRNIGAFYSFGTWQPANVAVDLPYIVMEFIAGISLQAKLFQEKRLSGKDTLAIGLQIADAMDHAHKAGVLHRDLKPTNILLIDEPEAGNLKIVDFGLSKLLGIADENLSKFTQTGDLVGTAHYMSPEVCSGQRADERSDIYSLGIILYQCLAGSLPHQADTPLGIMYKHMHDEPELVAAEIRANLPNGLEAVVLKSMAKNPSSRYESMGMLKEDLLKIEQGEGTQCLAVRSPISKAAARPVALRGYFLLLLLLILTAAIAGKSALFSKTEPKNQKYLRQIAADWTVTRNEAPEASKASKASKLAPKDDQALKLKFLSGLPGDLGGTKLIKEAQRCLLQGNLDGAALFANRLIEFRKSKRLGVGSQNLTAEMILGDVDCKRGLRESARAHYLRAKALIKKISGVPDQERFFQANTIMLRLTSTYTGEANDAELLALLEEFKKTDPQSVDLKIMRKLAELYSRLGRVEEAAEAYKTALRAPFEFIPQGQVEVAGNEFMERLGVYNDAVQILLEQNDLAGCKQFRQWLNKDLENSKIEERRVRLSTFQLELEAELLVAEHNDSKAIELLRKAAWNASTKPPAEFLWAQLMERLYILSGHKSDFAEFKALVEKRITRLLKTPGKLPDVPELSGLYEFCAGKPCLKQQATEIADGILKAAKVNKNPDELELGFLAKAEQLESNLQYAEALELLQQAIKIRGAHFGRVVECLLNLYFRRADIPDITKLVDAQTANLRTKDADLAWTLYEAKYQICRNSGKLAQAMVALDELAKFSLSDEHKALVKKDRMALFVFMHDWQKARELYNKCRSPGVNSIDINSSEDCQLIFLRATGLFEEAAQQEKIFLRNRFLALQAKSAKPNTSMHCLHLAKLALDCRQFGEAEKLCLQGLASAKREGESKPKEARILATIGQTYLLNKQVDKALSYFEKAISICNEDYDELVWAWHYSAWGFWRKGDEKRAAAMLKQQCDMNRIATGNKTGPVFWGQACHSHVLLGQLLASQNHYADADYYFKEQNTLSLEDQLSWSTICAWIDLNRAQMFIKAKDFAKADKCLRSCSDFACNNLAPYSLFWHQITAMQIELLNRQGQKQAAADRAKQLKQAPAIVYEPEDWRLLGWISSCPPVTPGVPLLALWQNDKATKPANCTKP